ncbi:hypothetical protein [Evansella halocellulosilytica]|uniref:hypothetical protein n=1 Tax=Evansella halocellulosilytica TaxID=2011013 RepID=UPI000BB7791A|nr:hypothetical protein [Evansella halocellulosilytica]
MDKYSEAIGVLYAGFLFISVTLGIGLGIILNHYVIGPLLGIGVGIGLGLLAHGFVSLKAGGK